jgi:transglutaminase-like putative cysteine protease
MLLDVVHETRYAYAPAVRTAQHLAHLRPVATPRQEVLSHELEIHPEPEQRSESADVFGNVRTFFTLTAPHAKLRVLARSRLRTRAAPLPDADMSWEAARERQRYHREAAYDPAAEFAFASPYIPRDPEFMAFALPSFRPGRPLGEAATDLMQRIHDEFEYVTAATDAGTQALDALRLRKGVCQDFAHVMIGCLRSLGLPARYVSGYLLTEPPPGKTRLVGADASHAWVSLYVPGDGEPGDWMELDPTNRRAPGEDYVTLAVGRDYFDVAPVRGVLHGGGNHKLAVAVTVSPVE